MKARRADGTWAARQAECHPDKRHKGNGLCVTCYSREKARRNQPANRERSRAWYAANREKAVASSSGWNRDNPGRHRETVRLYRYGLTRDEYAALMERQGGVCPICLSPFDPSSMRTKEAVDHDHDTGEVRGILHVACNAGIGLLGDSSERVERALAYLRRAGA